MGWVHFAFPKNVGNGLRQMCVSLKRTETDSSCVFQTVSCKSCFLCHRKGIFITLGSVLWKVSILVWRWRWSLFLRASSQSWWPGWTAFTSRRTCRARASSTRSSVTATTDTSPTTLTTRTITTSFTKAGGKTRPSDHLLVPARLTTRSKHSLRSETWKAIGVKNVHQILTWVLVTFLGKKHEFRYHEGKLFSVFLHSSHSLLST